MPVDFVIDALVAGSRDAASVGETFHLVDPDPLTARELLRLMSREYAGREPDYRVPSGIVRESLRIKPLRRFLGNTPRESIRYLNHQVRFDTRRAGDMLERQGLRCPHFDEYVGAIVDFFRRHETDAAFFGEGLRKEAEAGEEVFA